MSRRIVVASGAHVSADTERFAVFFAEERRAGEVVMLPNNLAQQFLQNLLRAASAVRSVGDRASRETMFDCAAAPFEATFIGERDARLMIDLKFGSLTIRAELERENLDRVFADLNRISAPETVACAYEWVIDPRAAC